MTESVDLRLAHLAALETLTSAEMDELIRLAPLGTFCALPNLYDIGVLDVPKAVANRAEGAARSHKALQQGCFIEVLALRAQHIEYWLRLFWASKNRNGKVFSPTDKRTLGVIINDCTQIGFDEALAQRLLRENEQRIAAVHKYLLGGTDYSALREACEIGTGLDKEIFEYVILAIGKPVTSIEETIGANVIRLNSQLRAKLSLEAKS